MEEGRKGVWGECVWGKVVKRDEGGVDSGQLCWEGDQKEGREVDMEGGRAAGGV